MTHDNKLNKKQKEAVYLLSIGTFLEYFDLMLYVHMAVLLNEIFFPQTDPLTIKLTTIFTFCSTFILRPVGGLIVGWIVDHIGRKNTVAITTIMMALCCVIMATLRPYAEIGIIASFTVIFYRMLQGFTSMGEILGAQLYMVESLKPPHSYICTSILNIQSKVGGSFALLVAYISTSVAFEWRIAFWVGAVIAIIGILARTRLRETPEFVDYK
jgi:MFS family permease